MFLHSSQLLVTCMRFPMICIIYTISFVSHEYLVLFGGWLHFVALPCSPAASLLIWFRDGPWVHLALLIMHNTLPLQNS